MRHTLPALFILLTSFLLLSTSSRAQPSLTADYAVNRADSDIFYGTAVNYRGCTDSLFMDLYKPVDSWTQRPIVILLHGGGFYAGQRKAPSIVRLADSIASRGYLVASVQYRLGYHQRANINPSFGCLFFSALTGQQLDACAYPYDSSEVYRAAYRAVQDVKGAIRFLKGRAAQDSTDKNRVFLGGESAGGVISLSVATLDQASEKPAAAGALSTVPTPTGLAICNQNTCGTTDYSRPDLGGIDGTLWQNGENTDLEGVLSFSGGLLDPSWMDVNPVRPRLYLYHQPCDPVVSFNRKRIYQDMQSCIVCAGCPGFGQIPFISGGGALDVYNSGLASPFQVTADFTPVDPPINCYFGLWGPDFNTCPQTGTCGYCSNTSLHTCHDLLMNPVRMQEISLFLYNSAIGTDEANAAPRIELYPSPASDRLRVRVEDCGDAGGSVAIFNLAGQALLSGVELQSCEAVMDLTGVPAGLYFLRVTGEEGRQAVRKFVVGR